MTLFLGQIQHMNVSLYTPASIGYSTTTRAVWFILLEHEGRRPEGESNINHTARKVVE